MLFYRAALPLSSRTLNFTAGAIRRHRKATGSLWRKLDAGQQALLVLVHLKKGETFAQAAAGRVMLSAAEMIVHLAFQGALGHHLGQLSQQPALAGQLQPARAGPLGELAQQLLTGSRESRAVLVLLVRHICHGCLLVCHELHR